MIRECVGWPLSADRTDSSFSSPSFVQSVLPYLSCARGLNWGRIRADERTDLKRLNNNEGAKNGAGSDAC